MGVPEARNHFQIAFDSAFQPTFSIRHQSEFSKSHPVNCRNRKASNSRFELGIQDRAIDIEAVGIRPVKDYDFLPPICTDGHQTAHRHIIGIVPESYILDVDKEDVELVQAGGKIRLAAVERHYLYPCAGVDTTGNFFSGIRRTSETMLGGQDQTDIDALPQKYIDQMWTETRFSDHISNYAGLVAEYSHSFPYKARDIFIEPLVA